MNSISFFLEFSHFRLSIVKTLDGILSRDNLLSSTTQTFVNQKKFIYLSGKAVCKKLLSLEEEICYDDRGAPYLDSGKTISITHSRNVVAMALSDMHLIGIDVEFFNPEKLLKVYPKLLSAKEREYVSNEDPMALAVVWGIKECLFKINDKNEWSFSEAYELAPFSLKHKKAIKCSIKSFPNKTFYAFYTFFDQFTFCLVSDSELIAQDCFDHFPLFCFNE